MPNTINQFNYGEALQKSFLFYEAQRSGKLPNDNRIAWRGDSGLDDGSDVDLDLSGGYYDAGDLVKFHFPMAASMTMLAWGVEEYRSGYETSGQLDEALDAIKWGTDYFLQSHVSDGTKTLEYWAQVGDKPLDQSYWESVDTMTIPRPAFKIDPEHPGSDLAAETAAAMASASIIFAQTNAAYSNTLLENSIQLYEFAETYLGKYSDSLPEEQVQPYYNSSGYGDELAWGAMWLYKATGDTDYLDKAKSYHPDYLGDWSHSWDSKTYGTAVLLAEETGAAKYLNQVEGWLDQWVDGNGGIEYTEGGFALRSSWGSFGLTANTAFLASIYSSQVSDDGGRYADFVDNQLNYMLGDNPRNFSYQVGFGDNYPLQPHHKNAHEGSWSTFHDPDPNAHVLYGALVGGIKSVDDFDYLDSRGDYITNEVALDYNAGFTGALAYLYEQYGGQPLSDQELNALPEITIQTGTVSQTPETPVITETTETTAIGEVGLIENFDHNQQTISLQNDYVNPVLFAQPLSYNGADPAIVRMTEINTTNDTISFYLQEPEYKDGSHTKESFSYMVVEAGTWKLADGTLLEVGTLNTNQTTSSGWENISFSHNFTEKPVVLSQVQTNNGEQFVRTRQQNANLNNFSVTMEQEEALKNTAHAQETIGWLAISASSGDWNGLDYQAGNTGNVVNHNWHQLDFNGVNNTPNLLGSIATYNGSDASGLRYREIAGANGSTIEIKIEEDQSFDSEQQHATEEVNFLAIEGSGILTAQADPAENDSILAAENEFNVEATSENNFI